MDHGDFSLVEYEAALEYPIGIPPAGVIPNFVDPPSRRWQIYATVGICAPIVIVFAAMRLWTKFMMQKKYRVLDECIFLIATIASLVFFAIAIGVVAVAPVIGHHAWDVQLKSVSTVEMVFEILAETVYPLSTFFVKLALFLLYLELFGIVTWLRICVYIGIAVTIIFHSIAVAIMADFCTPHTGYTQADYFLAFAGSSCSRVQSLSVSQGVFNIIGDIYLLVLPLPIIWSLQMRIRKKLGILVMFLTGICALAASTVGCAYRIKLAVQVDAKNDNTWVVVPTHLTSIAEMTAGIMIASMPCVVTFSRRSRAAVSQWTQRLNSLDSTAYESAAKTGSHQYSGSGPSEKMSAGQVRLEKIKKSGFAPYRGPDTLDTTTMITHDETVHDRAGSVTDEDSFPSSSTKINVVREFKVSSV